jgi:hypothetical protein
VRALSMALLIGALTYGFIGRSEISAANILVDGQGQSTIIGVTGVVPVQGKKIASLVMFRIGGEPIIDNYDDNDWHKISHLFNSVSGTHMVHELYYLTASDRHSINIRRIVSREYYCAKQIGVMSRRFSKLTLFFEHVFDIKRYISHRLHINRYSWHFPSMAARVK